MQSLSQRQLETLRLMEVDVWQLRPDVPHSSVVDESIEFDPKPYVTAGTASAELKSADNRKVERESVTKWPQEASLWRAVLEGEGGSDWVFVCQFASEIVPETVVSMQLFDALLFSLGLGRQEVAIISAWPSPGDDAAETRSLETLLYDYCVKYQPKIGVVLGSECASAVLGSNKEAGKLHHHYCFGEENLPLVRTHGLDVLIAHPENKADTWQALAQALQIVER